MRDYKLGQTQIGAHGRPVFREIVQIANGHDRVILVVRDDIAMSIASALCNAYYHGRRDLADERELAIEEPEPEKISGEDPYGEYQQALDEHARDATPGRERTKRKLDRAWDAYQRSLAAGGELAPAKNRISS